MAHKCHLKTFHELTLEIRSDKKSETYTVEIGGVATQELSTNTLDLPQHLPLWRAYLYVYIGIDPLGMSELPDLSFGRYILGSDS